MTTVNRTSDSIGLKYRGRHRIFRLDCYDQNRIHLTLSDSQDGDMGNLLSNMYYIRPSLVALAPGRDGYPHNGGEHTLHLKGAKEDLLAFLDLVIETYSECKGAERFTVGLETVKKIRAALATFK